MTNQVQCGFCNQSFDEETIIRIQPYRPKGWSPLIPYKEAACPKCFESAKTHGHQVVPLGNAPVVTEETAEEEEQESPNPMKGASMLERVQTVLGLDKDAEKLGDPEE